MVFCLMLRAVFVIQIFAFLYWIFGFDEKRFDKKTRVNFKIYDATDWTTNN